MDPFVLSIYSKWSSLFELYGINQIKPLDDSYDQNIWWEEIDINYILEESDEESDEDYINRCY